MNHIISHSTKKQIQIAGFIIVKLMLCLALLHLILMMQKRRDDAPDIQTASVSQKTKRIVEIRAPYFPMPPEYTDSATRAIFTSPSPPRRALRTTESASNHPPPMSTTSEAAPLQLPFERSKIGEDALSDSKINNILTEEDFLSRIYEYESQSISDPDAIALTGLYRQVAQRAIHVSGSRARIAGFACGMQICVGALADGDEHDYWSWRDAFAPSPELSGSGLREVMITPEGHAPTLRFSFSVTPDSISSK